LSSDRPGARFDAGVAAWRNYLSSPLGRLRATLEADLLRPLAAGLPAGARVLDAGCGLAQHGGLWLERGCTLTLCDFAPAMLRAAEADLRERFPGAGDRLRPIEAPIAALPELLAGEAFDLVLAHTVLELVEDAEATLGALAALLSPRGALSCMVANRHSEVWRAALKESDPGRAARILDARCFSSELFGDAPRRTFDEAEVGELFDRVGLAVGRARGLRIFADLLPPGALGDAATFNAALELERAAAEREPHRHLARYVHIVGGNTNTLAVAPRSR